MTTTGGMKIFSINKNILFYNAYKDKCGAGTIFKNLNFVHKLLRRCCVKYFPSLVPWFYTKEFKHCGLTEKEIIIFDSSLTIGAANYIKKKYPETRVIYWFWNHITNPDVLLRLDRDIEKWTYDEEDAKKYKLYHNTQFYFRDFVTVPTRNNILSDCLFVGSDKKRRDELLKLETNLNKRHLKSLFLIISDNKHTRGNKLIPYDEIIGLIKSTKCIVDIIPTSQTGMSLRPLEALFFKRKLITNFSKIKTYSFYTPSNIFILGEDDPEKLNSFINSSYTEIPDEIVEEFDFHKWLNRFSKNQ